MTDHDTDAGLGDESHSEGRTGRMFKTLLIAGLIAVLAAGVLYLLAERNSRHYFLVAEGGQLLVQRGIFFPVGEKRFTPEDPDFARAYDPVPIPAGAEVESRQSFSERTELDRVLVNQLLAWSRERIDPEQPDRLEQGIYYLRRAETLPTTTSAQRGEMEVLRGEVAYHEGRRFIELALRNLDTARERLLQARDSPAGWGRESRQLLRAIREPEAALRQVLREEESTRTLAEPEPVEIETEPEGRDEGPDEEPETQPPPATPSAQETPAEPEQGLRLAPRPPSRQRSDASAPEQSRIRSIDWSKTDTPAEAPVPAQRLSSERDEAAEEAPALRPARRSRVPPATVDDGDAATQVAPQDL